ncbi:transposase [Actinospica robiniae]|uniref:transposase n=1 Tax=Actinospica robiniae TaxID=304901 RepID=UPI0004077A07|nr:transposase [Actinospica robiniae]
MTGARIAADDARLLALLSAPAALQDLPQISTLRQVWAQKFHLLDGILRRREAKDRLPGAKRLVTPYGTEARGSVKRETIWDGYKVHFTETCGAQTPNLITHVVTTRATVTDVEVLPADHDALAKRALLPEEHFVDSGYVSGHHIVDAHARHVVHLRGPTHADTGWQRRAEKGFGTETFTIDWDQQHAICPNGKTSIWWAKELQREKAVIRVQFSRRDCGPCPMKQDCTRGKRRQLSIQEREVTEALRKRRAEEQDPLWKTQYKIRAGVEGTISRAVHRS